jgi:hypothetical protein
MLPKKKKKREESAAAHWCFKVCSPYDTIFLFPGSERVNLVEAVSTGNFQKKKFGNRNHLPL